MRVAIVTMTKKHSRSSEKINQLQNDLALSIIDC